MLAGLTSVVVGIVTSTTSSGIEVRHGLLLSAVGARLRVSAWRRRSSSRYGGPDRRDGAVDLLLSALLLVVGLAGLIERSSALALGLSVLMAVCSLPLLLAELRAARVARAESDLASPSRVSLPAPAGATVYHLRTSEPRTVHSEVACGADRGRSRR